MYNKLYIYNFCSLSNDVICMLKPVGPKITLPRVITLPHFPLLKYTMMSVKGVLVKK